MTKNLSSILKSTIAEEERAVQKKPMTLEDKLLIVDNLKHAQHEKDAKDINLDRVVAKTFTFKNADLKLIDALIERYLGMREKVNKSEILKLGINVLSSMSDHELSSILSKIERLTPGRK